MGNLTTIADNVEMRQNSVGRTKVKKAMERRIRAEKLIYFQD